MLTHGFRDSSRPAPATRLSPACYTEVLAPIRTPPPSLTADALDPGAVVRAVTADPSTNA
jgi:hypothetical protein